MGQAIAKALVAKKFKTKIVATDKKKTAVSGVVFDPDFKTLEKADIVIVAVKPQDIVQLTNEIKAKIGPQTVIISIAAGVRISKLTNLFGHKKIVRMMPNLGLAVGEGIAAWKSNLSAQDKKSVKPLLNAITENFEVSDEKLIDAVTAISGSGPAYFFFLADSLLSAGIKLGLSASQAKMLVQKTMSAAAKLQESGDYKDLISKIRSKKGTTDAALKVFQKKNLSAIINQAVLAAHKRAGELSNA